METKMVIITPKQRKDLIASAYNRGLKMGILVALIITIIKPKQKNKERI